MVKRARKATPPAPPKGPPAGRPLISVLLTLGAAGALLFGLSRIGDEARRNIGPRDRYAVRFLDIRCDPPPGTSRVVFLAEVRYGTRVPLALQALDPELVPTLRAAFEAHPWVAGVDAVTVDPPNVVSVKLTFRAPVLAVPVGSGTRAVDAKGILLPPSAPTAGLPELLNAVVAPGKAGQPWPDDVVVRAAPVAAEYKPKSIERTAQGWQLIQPDGKKLLVGR